MWGRGSLGNKWLAWELILDKAAMTSTHVLAMQDFAKPFVLETDASGFGLEAVLLHNERPIAFYSQTPGPRARSKPIYEMELIAIILAVLKWRPYLSGQRFLIRTNQKSLIARISGVLGACDSAMAALGFIAH